MTPADWIILAVVAYFMALSAWAGLSLLRDRWATYRAGAEAAVAAPESHCGFLAAHDPHFHGDPLLLCVGGDESERVALIRARQEGLR